MSCDFPRKDRKLPTLPTLANLFWESCGCTSPDTRCSLDFFRGVKPDKINGRKKMHTIPFQERHQLKRERNNNKGEALASSIYKDQKAALEAG